LATGIAGKAKELDTKGVKGLLKNAKLSWYTQNFSWSLLLLTIFLDINEFTAPFHGKNMLNIQRNR
jgi:hypothetical protein